MYEERVVLCGANSYERKFYLNPDFEALPSHVKDELKIMCRYLETKFSVFLKH